jgi:hypothetical protein
MSEEQYRQQDIGEGFQSPKAATHERSQMKKQGI